MLIFQTMKRMQPGQILDVVAYDLAAAVDIPAWCRSTGTTLLRADTTTHPNRFLLRKEQ